MTSVAKRLSVADNETAIRWLRKNKVPVHRVGVKNLCYQIDFDHAAAKQLVNQICIDYPNDWEKALEEIIPYEPLLRKILRNLDKSRTLNPKKKKFKEVLPTSKDEENVFNKLSSLL